MAKDDMVTVRFQTPTMGETHDRKMRADLVDAVRAELEPQGYSMWVLPPPKKRGKPIDLPSHEEIETLLLDIVNIQARLGQFRAGLEKAWLATKPKEPTDG